MSLPSGALPEPSLTTRHCPECETDFEDLDSPDDPACPKCGLCVYQESEPDPAKRLIDLRDRRKRKMKVNADQARELEEKENTYRGLRTRIATAFEAVRSWPAEQRKACRKPSQDGFFQWGQLWVEA